MDYFCVDLESSGPFPGVHNLLSIGLTQVHGADYSTGAELYLELKPKWPGFDERAMAVNGLDRARLEREGLVAEEAMRRIVDWVHRVRIDSEDRPVFVAHNAPYDWMFFTFEVGQAGLSNPFGFAALDLKALAMGILGLSWPETNLRAISRAVEAEHPDPTLLHHAGQDARHTARVFAALMDRRARGLV